MHSHFSGGIGTHEKTPDFPIYNEKRNRVFFTLFHSKKQRGQNVVCGLLKCEDSSQKNGGK